MQHILEQILRYVINYGILLFEYIGVAILIVTGVQGVIAYIKKDPHMRLRLAQGMATALTFKLGGEILRTVIVQSFSEIAIVGCIIALRSALTFLIHWEIKHMEHEEEINNRRDEREEPAPDRGESED